MPQVSIIVPIYNVEKYLSKCLESIVNQDFFDYELLLIDDGSPDNSAEICLKFAEKDSRVKYFKKGNGGLSSARNYGIDKSSGRYIVFVDPDDFWLSESALSVMYNTITSKSADVIRWEYVRVNEDGCTIETATTEFKRAYNNAVLSTRDFFKYAINRDYFAWLFMFNRSIFNSLRFNNNQRFQEDIEFIIRLCTQEHKCIYINDRLYAYRQRRESLISSHNIGRFAGSFSICDSYFSNAELARATNLCHEYYSLAITHYYKTIDSILEGRYNDSRRDILRTKEARRAYSLIKTIVLQKRVKNRYSVVVILPPRVTLSLIRIYHILCAVISSLKECIRNER